MRLLQKGGTYTGWSEALLKHCPQIIHRLHRRRFRIKVAKCIHVEWLGKSLWLEIRRHLRRYLLKHLAESFVPFEVVVVLVLYSHYCSVFLELLKRGETAGAVTAVVSISLMLLA